MARQVGIGLLAVFGVLGAGLFVTWLVKSRAAQDRVYCANNLRELAQFAALYADAGKKKGEPVLAAVPAGTIVIPGLPPDRRPSWVPATLPLFNQRRQPVADLVKLVDPKRAWDEGSNARLAETKLVALICPGNPAEAPEGRPQPTQYPGLAGLGADAATLPLGPPVPPRAGCFRYDAPTPLDLIAGADGLSQTLLFGETGDDPGPWLRGGRATVRGLDDAPGAKPYIGPGGQFGGNHPEGANFAYSDGAVRLLTPRVDADVLKAQFTIAGGPTETAGD